MATKTETKTETQAKATSVTLAETATETKTETITEPKVETRYSVADFMEDYYHIFRTSPDIVKTALSLDGKVKYTLDEAKKVVEAFKHKEVK